MIVLLSTIVTSVAGTPPMVTLGVEDVRIWSVLTATGMVEFIAVPLPS
ncbi:hypothetical protein HG436_001200 [Candidatus Saccharibacteria bacterium]|nr:hypothetical protein [Candidatus Saccharibacteria bacterium]